MNTLRNYLGNMIKSVWKKKRYRAGRGDITAGLGHKGQRQRSSKPGPGFEGGQTPVQRRLPKRKRMMTNNKRFDRTFSINVLDMEKKMKNDPVDLVHIVKNFDIPFYYKNIKIIGNGKEKYEKFTKKTSLRNIFKKNVSEKTESIK